MSRDKDYFGGRQQKGEFYFPLCNSCKHRSKTNTLLCAAYPRGIPLGVLKGILDHTKPLEGDSGIQYEKTA